MAATDLLARMKELGAPFLRRASLNDCYRRVFDTPDGKRVLADLCERAGILQTSMVEGEPQMTAFNEGKRAIALHLIGELRWRAADVIALAEQRADETTRDILERAA